MRQDASGPLAPRLRLAPRCSDSVGPAAPTTLAGVGWPKGRAQASLTPLAPVHSTTSTFDAGPHSSPAPAADCRSACASAPADVGARAVAAHPYSLDSVSRFSGRCLPASAGVEA